MSMTETPTAPAPKPKPVKKRRRAKRVRTAAPAKPKQISGIFEGLAVGKCPTGCTAEKCVISGVGICANPGLGGLQASLHTPETLARFNEAKRILGEQKLDLTKFR